MMMIVNMELMVPRLLPTTLAVVTGLVTIFLVKLHRVRSFIRQLQKQGLVYSQTSYLFHDSNTNCTQSPCLRTTGF